METGWLIFISTVAAFAGWLWRDLTGAWPITDAIEAAYTDGHVDGYDKGYDRGYMDGYRQCEEDARADANGR